MYSWKANDKIKISYLMKVAIDYKDGTHITGNDKVNIISEGS